MALCRSLLPQTPDADLLENLDLVTTDLDFLENRISSSPKDGRLSSRGGLFSPKDGRLSSRRDNKGLGYETSENEPN